MIICDRCGDIHEGSTGLLAITSVKMDPSNGIVFYRSEPIPGPRTKAQQERYDWDHRGDEADAAFKRRHDSASKPVRSAYDFLSELIDRLGDFGVDVSYFPTEANEIVMDFAEKLIKEFSV